ncbi:diacylglycerol/lipid kinase family protein [Sphingomonas canadensis]|uniref:Diacylglycerol/lipid kinase family protein n=1 Tax=Sphingomonas canadensis TaxID=1219257 RepID=A0ABW3HBV5_9SPHN|nr:diacylglycerol kinase family protein [Sphingomonas canadensis]MCW3838421.1 diacylglycerol kinase family protein [Sphingomonas canadensis]
MNFQTGTLLDQAVGLDRPALAVLTNPASTGNRQDLDRVRAFCADRDDVFHVEVERAEDVGDALARVLASRPHVLVVNGGDGTVQSVLTRLLEAGETGSFPPIAVMPNGKTNLIAKDLSATGDPVRALERMLTLARRGCASSVVSRQLIRLDTGGEPVLGMFLAAGALEDVILFCRHKIYPLGLPNGVSHTLTVIAGLVSVFTGLSGRFLPPKPTELNVTVGDHAPLKGKFQVLMVTTLRRLVLSGTAPPEREGTLQLLAVERRSWTLIALVFATLIGKLGKWNLRGVHLKMGAEIRIEDERTGVLMDGELFAPTPGKPIVLTPTRPLRFLDLGQATRALDPVRDDAQAVQMHGPQLATGNALLSEPR